MSEQGGFNEKLDAILLRSQGDFLKDEKTNEEIRQDAKAAIRTLVLEEIIGENELSYSIPQGMPESVYNRFKGADELRAKQRKKLEDTNGTK